MKIHRVRQKSCRPGGGSVELHGLKENRRALHCCMLFFYTKKTENTQTFFSSYDLKCPKIFLKRCAVPSYETTACQIASARFLLVTIPSSPVAFIFLFLILQSKTDLCRREILYLCFLLVHQNVKTQHKSGTLLSTVTVIVRITSHPVFWVNKSPVLLFFSNTASHCPVDHFCSTRFTPSSHSFQFAAVNERENFTLGFYVSFYVKNQTIDWYCLF